MIQVKIEVDLDGRFRSFWNVSDRFFSRFGPFWTLFLVFRIVSDRLFGVSDRFESFGIIFGSTRRRVGYHY